MTRLEEITKSPESLADIIMDLSDESPFAPCTWCEWDKMRTPTGRMKKEAKHHCCNGDCKAGVIMYFKSEVTS